MMSRDRSLTAIGFDKVRITSDEIFKVMLDMPSHVSQLPEAAEDGLGKVPGEECARP